MSADGVQKLDNEKDFQMQNLVFSSKDKSFDLYKIVSFENLCSGHSVVSTRFVC